MPTVTPTDFATVREIWACAARRATSAAIVDSRKISWSSARGRELSERPLHTLSNIRLETL
jgi:hypothetical protein